MFFFVIEIIFIGKKEITKDGNINQGQGLRLVKNKYQASKQ